MSKITNDGLTWSGTGCFIAGPYVKGLTFPSLIHLEYNMPQPSMTSHLAVKSA